MLWKSWSRSAQFSAFKRVGFHLSVALILSMANWSKHNLPIQIAKHSNIVRHFWTIQFLSRKRNFLCSFGFLVIDLDLWLLSISTLPKIIVNHRSLNVLNRPLCPAEIYPQCLVPDQTDCPLDMWSPVIAASRRCNGSNTLNSPFSVALKSRFFLVALLLK
jgi:hypothetical protein